MADREVRKDKKGHARRKRMTEAITPALKPTPLEESVGRVNTRDSAQEGRYPRLHDEVCHYMHISPSATSARASRSRFSITSLRHGVMLETYSSGQTGLNRYENFREISKRSKG